ncbi:hypothetical protein ACC675_38255, partial [Rhizobium ruizarguesonis]
MSDQAVRPGNPGEDREEGSRTMSTLDPVAVFRTESAECLEAIEAGLLDLTHQDGTSARPWNLLVARSR